MVSLAAVKNRFSDAPLVWVWHLGESWRRLHEETPDRASFGNLNEPEVRRRFFTSMHFPVWQALIEWHRLEAHNLRCPDASASPSVIEYLIGGITRPARRKLVLRVGLLSKCRSLSPSPDWFSAGDGGRMRSRPPLQSSGSINLGIRPTLTSPCKCLNPGSLCRANLVGNSRQSHESKILKI